MSVAEVGAQHARYVRAADRFKSIWTYNQFATGVFKNFLSSPPPYRVDFQQIYDSIKAVAGKLNSAQVADAVTALDSVETALARASRILLLADDAIGPSLVRRFFEKLKHQDDGIIQQLIKFYFYADAVEGDHRDKIDFLFTRIGEDYVPERGEFVSRESLEFRERVIALVSALHVAEAPRSEVMQLIIAIRSMREEIVQAKRFDDLTERNLLKNTRTFKHRVGDLYFDPDVLLAIIELNVATKNRFLALYQREEQRLLVDAQKLMDHGNSLERNFGDANPELADEIARFREFKERFDSLRAESNVKHDLIAQLKSSMSNILAQLDRGLESDEVTAVHELPETFFDETRPAVSVSEMFGRDEVLFPFLNRIASAIDPIAATLTEEQITEVVIVRELRLEPWEVAAYQKLTDRREPEADEDNEELWTVYLRAAALRMKVDEEATILATAMAADMRPDAELLSKAKQSLDSAKELDELFADFLQEAVYYSNPRILHQLYRSRFRLLRGFSGLWLIYDRQS